MKKSISILLIALLSIILLSSNVFANTTKTKLDVVQKSAETKYLENNQGSISKSIINSNAEAGEVTVELKLDNSKITTDGQKKYDNTEVLIIVNENISKKSENLEKYTNYIKTLASNIFSKNANTKVGIIGMKGPIDDATVNEEGKLVHGPNDQKTVNGTTANAEVIVEPTNDISAIQTGLQNMNTQKTVYYENLQAAIRLANNTFSSNVNRILVSLYDNVPTTAVGVCSQAPSYGGIFSEYATAEEAIIAKHKKLVSYTKQEILKLKQNNIHFILLRPDDTSFDQDWYSHSTGEFILKFDGSPYVQQLYGTVENPTYGKMYSLSESNLQTVVTEYIYNDIINTIGYDISSVIVKDYFPQEILDYFTITVLDNEKVDTSHLLTDGYIELSADCIKSEENLSIKYTLKVKDMQESNILEKTISTNKKVELSYKDYTNTQKLVDLTSSPKIKLSEVKQEVSKPSEPDKSTTPPKDTTTATGKLPQTGINMTIIICIACVSTLTAFTYIKFKKYKDIN